MKPLLLSLILFSSVLVNGQNYTANRNNSIDSTWDWYVPNSPGSGVLNSRWTAKYRDSLYSKWAWLRNYFLNMTDTANHGAPASIAWFTSDGLLRRSPKDSIAVTNAMITSLNWAKLISTPTTLSGYGISDAVSISTYTAGLAGKENTIAAGTTAQYWRGDKTFQDFNTACRLAFGAGTGISYNSGTGVITNSAPDQTVVLTGSGTVSTSGTYPNFTITGTAPGTSNAAGYLTGTAYTLTTTSAKVTGGTTSPTVTLPATGTYLLLSNITIDYNGLTTLSLTNASFKLRRTNNTAGDISNTTNAFRIPVLTLTSMTAGDADINAVIYAGTSGDVIEVWGNLGATVSVGSVTITNGYLVAIKLF